MSAPTSPNLFSNNQTKRWRLGSYRASNETLESLKGLEGEGNALTVLNGLLSVELPATLSSNLDEARSEDQMLWAVEHAKDPNCQKFRNLFEQHLLSTQLTLDSQCAGSWARLFHTAMKLRGETMDKTTYNSLIVKCTHYTNVARSSPSIHVATSAGDLSSVMLNQRTDAFRFRLAVHDLLSFLELHGKDPENSLVGLTPTRAIVVSVLNCSSLTNEQKQEIELAEMVMNIVQLQKKKTDKSVKNIDKKYSLNNEAKRRAEIILERTKTPKTQVNEKGALVVVAVDHQWYLKATTRAEMKSSINGLKHPEGTMRESDLWLFARMWEEKDGMVSVYLDPYEDRLFSIPKNRSAAFPETLIPKLFDCKRMESLVVDPAECCHSVILTRIKLYTEEALMQRGIVKSLGLFDQWKAQLYSVSDLPQIKETRSHLKVLKEDKLPEDILDLAEEIIATHLMSFDNQDNAFFEPTKSRSVEKLKQTSAEQLVKVYLSNVYNICELALEDLRSMIRGELLSGNVLNQMNSWWLDLIETKVKKFLTQYNFDHNAIPDDYAERRPDSMVAIKRNGQLIKGILNEFAESRQKNQNGQLYVKTEVDLLIEGLKLEIYPVIDEYMDTIKIILCDYLDKELDEYDTQLFGKKLTNESDAFGLKMKRLYEDIQLLERMKSLEDQNEKSSKDIVPVTGLIINIFIRSQMDLEQVVTLWK